jgi:CDP-diacylglycerol--serine O-phosphatidyltransferase
MKQIPNLFTLLNLIAGCLAIVFILQTGEGIINYNGQDWKIYLPEKIWWGSVCIGIAGIIDFLDGFVARLFGAESEIGKQLDSLADIVSFGVAPGLILYQLLRISYISEESGLDTSFWA